MLLLRSILFTILMPGTVTALLPYVLLSFYTASSDHWSRQYLGIPLIVIGGLRLLWCIWEFYSRGRGTLAPVDPPKSLVVYGLYRYVRNPMYVSVVTILIGESIYFRSIPILIEAATFLLLTHLFVVLYEEPILRNQFGGSYLLYTKNVGRWFPRLRLGGE
jgi:protein-S-isoprenylcysteine O-methyltransferase Ste14